MVEKICWKLYSAGTSVERFDMPDNLMMVSAVHEHGFRVHQMDVSAGRELMSLEGFRACLIDLSAFRSRLSA